MSTDLSIIFSYRNRDTQRVVNCLNTLKNQSDSNFEVVFIDYGSNKTYSHDIKAVTNNYTFCRYIYNDSRGWPWNRSHALNSGIKMAESPKIFTADIDLLFKENFVERVKELIVEDKPVFFSVGYLRPGVKDIKNLSQRDYTISESFALGLLGIVKKDFIHLSGYDEFYSFWGMEDNDLEYRLNRDNKISQFYKKELLIYHQYHKPAHIDHDVIPEGWKVFQTDYFNNKKYGEIISQVKWGKLYNKDNRPASDLYYDTDMEFTEIKGRVNFFTYCLVKALYDDKHYKFKIKDTFSVLHVRSNLGKFIKLFNKSFVSLPLKVTTKYNDQFAQIYYYRDAFIYFIWQHQQLISDYYFEVIEDELYGCFIKKE